MFFDDRLATVLRQRGDSDVGVRTQYRQLLDILGNRKYGRDHSMVAAAWLRMDALAERIPAGERAAMIRERGWRLKSADLAAHLADYEPEVASAALQRADLSDEDWATLIPRLPVRARGFLRLRRDLSGDTISLLDRLGVHDRGLPAPSGLSGNQSAGQSIGTSSIRAGRLADAPAPFDLMKPVPDNDELSLDETIAAREPDEVDAGRSEISALVERIAQFRRTRESETVDAELSPQLPLEEEAETKARRLSGFGFASDAAGRIEWAESEAAPSVIGTRLIGQRIIGSVGTESALERAYVRRQPISGTQVQLAGASAIAGEWIVDAQPRFTDHGNFTGYVGRFRRPAGDDVNGMTAAEREADRIRQLLHELRTPVTAIQGYAEVIQQQLFGPAPHEYRAMAASIAADSAHILSGFEELDRLARLEAGIEELVAGRTDLSAMVQRIVAQLMPVLTPRMAGIEFKAAPDAPVSVPIDMEDTEALVWRVLATCGGGCATGETLTCEVSTEQGMARMSCDVPAQLLDEEDLFAADAKPIAGNINAGIFGAGFALRLARAEATAAGGGLAHDGERVTLLLPLLTETEALPSQQAEA